MPDLAAIASGSAGPSLTAMKDAQQTQQAVAARLIAGLERSSQVIAASTPRGDTVRISPEAQQLYEAYGNG